jgi:hypothetical protein
MTYVIEKNIPIPPARGGNGAFPFADMEIGDSVLVPEEDAKRARASAAAATKRGPGKYSVRTVENGVRVFRVE